jgi:ABC-type proline/glycine betaine transport system permease subunit
VIVGALAVALLAVLTELGLGALERVVVPRGIAGAAETNPGTVGSAAAA